MSWERSDRPRPGLLARLRGAAVEEMFGSPVHMSLLQGPTPDRIAAFAEHLRKGSAERGEAMLDGVFAHGADHLMVGAEGDPWATTSPTRRFARRLHGFQWLADLAAVAGTGRRAAKRLAASWIATFGRWNAFAWRMDVLAERMISWTCHGEAFLADEDALARERALEVYARQIRHLAFAARDTPDPRVRLKALIALCLGCAATPDEARRLPGALEQLAEGLDELILADGGCITRNPEALADTLADLVVLDGFLKARDEAAPHAFKTAIERMGPMLRFFVIGDGGLPLFHGGGEGDPELIAQTLARVKPQGRTFSYAPQSGYHRVAAGPAIVMLDGAGAPPPEASGEAHASALALDLSIAGRRVFTSLGPAPSEEPAWQAAARHTAAHSALVLADTSSAPVEIARHGRPAQLTGPPGVTARRNEEERSVRLEARHEGWRAGFGLVHRRRIYVDLDGLDIRGEDMLFRLVTDGPSDRAGPVPYAIRFHVHPRVRVRRGEDARSVLLDIALRQIWRFRSDREITIENSVYFGAGRREENCQIVITGMAEPEGRGEEPPNRILWRLTPAERS